MSWGLQIVIMSLLVVLPGMMFIRFVGVAVGRASELSLAITLSLALNGIVAGGGLYAGVWEPTLFASIVAGVTVVFAVLAVSKRRLSRWRRLPVRADAAEEQKQTADVGGDRAIAPDAADTESRRLRRELERLKHELVEYRELVERLEAGVGRYRESSDRTRPLGSGTSMRDAPVEDDVRRESEAILEQARARLTSSLERLRTSRQDDPPQPREVE